jgi:hypothetical protein
MCAWWAIHLADQELELHQRVHPLIQRHFHVAGQVVEQAHAAVQVPPRLEEAHKGIVA